MIRVKNIVNEAVELGACYQSSKATDWKSLCWLFFSPQGREFCKNNNYPTLETFRTIKSNVRPFGVFVEENVNITNADAAIIGNCSAKLTYSGVDKAYKVIFMHGSHAEIRVEKYAVVRIENIGGNYNIINDGTGKVLI